MLCENKEQKFEDIKYEYPNTQLKTSSGYDEAHVLPQSQLVYTRQGQSFQDLNYDDVAVPDNNESNTDAGLSVNEDDDTKATNYQNQATNYQNQAPHLPPRDDTSGYDKLHDVYLNGEESCEDSKYDQPTFQVSPTTAPGGHKVKGHYINEK
ncbi:hypothetical protein Btru_060238 [Bulinus truncatus]|nr:hypothetical protein Btru_060238 [Bulinus truncatus]